MRTITIDDFQLVSSDKGNFAVAEIQSFNDAGQFVERKAFINEAKNPTAYAAVVAHLKKS